MVKKIRKVSKKGRKANYAVPLLMPLTVLAGARCGGKPLWNTFDDPPSIRIALSRHMDAPILLADRMLPLAEYLDWNLRSSPGRIAGMFERSAIIPMGPPPEDWESSQLPRLGLGVLVALVKGENLQSFFTQTGRELSEIDRVAFENAIGPCLQIIPGYDRFLYSPPISARSINQGIEYLNHLTREAFGIASVPYPGPFEPCPAEIVSSIPTHEPIIL